MIDLSNCIRLELESKYGDETKFDNAIICGVDKNEFIKEFQEKVNELQDLKNQIDHSYSVTFPHPLDTKTVSELKDLARSYGIIVPSKYNKAEIKKYIKEIYPTIKGNKLEERLRKAITEEMYGFVKDITGSGILNTLPKQKVYIGSSKYFTWISAEGEVNEKIFLDDIHYYKQLY